MKRLIRFLFPFLGLLGLFCQRADATEAQEMLNNRLLSSLPTDVLMQQAENQLRQGHADTAIAYYSLVAGMYNHRMNREEKHYCADAYLQIGKIHYNQNNLFQAFDNLLNGTQIAEHESFSDLLPELYKDLGRCYRAFSDYEKGKTYALKALEFARQEHQTTNESYIVNSLTTDYLALGNLDSAKFFYETIRQMPITDSVTIFNRFHCHALIALQEKQYDTAIHRLLKCASYATDKRLEKKFLDVAYGTIASIYARQGKYDSCLRYIRLITDNLERTHTHTLTQNVQLLFDILANIPDSPRKEKIKQRCLEIADTTFARYLNEYYGSNLNFVYEIEQNRREIEALAFEKEQQAEKTRTAWRTAAITGLTTLVLVFFFVVLSRQKKNLAKAYRDLFDKNKALIESELRAKDASSADKEWNKLLRQSAQEESFLTKPNPQENATEAKSREKKAYSSSNLDEDTKQQLFERIREVMENSTEYCQSDFNLNRLAEMVSSNTSYVSQVINECFHANFRSLVNKYRIREAQIRLLDTAKYGHFTIKAIAESVGYKSLANFIELFKTATGMTPAVYQKMAQKQ